MDSDNIIGLCDSVKVDDCYMDPETDMEQIICTIRTLIDDDNTDSAELLIKDIFSREPEYSSENPENMEDRLFSFNEPIEEEYFNYKFKLAGELKREPKIRTELFLMYAYILVERKEYDEALKLLDRGLTYNPVNTALLYEKTEICKTKGQWELYKAITDQCHEYSYKCGQLARAYRNYGYMLVEKEDYEGAVCAYIASLVYEKNDIAENELNYISEKTKKSIDTSYYLENAGSIFGQRDIRLGPNEDMCELAYVYAKNLEALKDYPAALYYYYRLYELTESDEAGDKVLKLERLVFGSN